MHSAPVPANVRYAPNSVQKYCGAANDAMCHSRHSLRRKKAAGYFTIAYALPDGTHAPVGAVDRINSDQRTQVADLSTTPSRVRLLFKN